jgi:hypothetical protein
MPRLRRWIFRDVTDLLLVKRAEKDGLWRVVLQIEWQPGSQKAGSSLRSE